MESFNEFINESEIYIDDRKYIIANQNKKPKGHGTWIFSKTSSINFDKHKEGVDYIEIRGDYKEAKKKAQAWGSTEKNTYSLFLVP